MLNKRTIELYDGAVVDDDLAALFDELPSSVNLLVLDSCFSGGFSKDVIAAEGRMGLFSSEEDVTSLVARKFEAGGFLSVFFADAINGSEADTDADGSLTALELSQYLHTRFRNDVKALSTDDYVRADLNYQHVVVDRGGVGPHDVIFGNQ